ncbi:MAG TPA: hypothetical protein VNF29_00690 [Candidatus Binataceae bacterium]|nr:hypothetical protein [Candidatus Binataceae bacterium]
MKLSAYKFHVTIAALAVLIPSVAGAAETAAETPGSWLTLGFFAANFAAFLFIVIRFAAPLARSFFTDRAASIRSSLEKSQRALAEAEALAGAAESRKSALAAELARVKVEFETETNFQAARIRELARAGAERHKRDGQMTAGAIAEAAQRRVRARLAAASARLARDLIARDFSADDQGRLIDGFMDRLGQEGRR